jgi:hypothetical protein
MKIRFWIDTEAGDEAEVVALFQDGALIDISVFSYSFGNRTSVALPEKQFEAVEQRAIAMYEQQGY